MRLKPITTKEAVDHLSHQLKNDSQYRESWKSTIAMAVKDTAAKMLSKRKNKAISKTDLHKIANDGAELFIQQFADEIKYPEGR